jgi:21S rRNA (uridine2791-2'-O)-methyltransferase
LADRTQGFAPGSWSQVAADRTGSTGRVIGIDIIPAQPPKGVSTIQGNFLSPAVQEEVKRFVLDPDQGRPKEQKFLASDTDGAGVTADDLDEATPKLLSSIDSSDGSEAAVEEGSEDAKANGRVVDVVLSDMSAPWAQITGFHKRSLSNPHYRMMNTSGMGFRDHAGSMVSGTSTRPVRSCDTDSIVRRIFATRHYPSLSIRFAREVRSSASSTRERRTRHWRRA